ncbi:hypothetical protein PIB30_088107 [Stylosanthes scabra]|uniref:Uncharacterized protein n=1 Tax=Stylosanthes scabra TaxID=79078 RepID=A0ABU6TUB6_9FABA|nr:hypothetical protein [Stylosanthes scabra]
MLMHVDGSWFLLSFRAYDVPRTSEAWSLGSVVNASSLWDPWSKKEFLQDHVKLRRSSRTHVCTESKHGARDGEAGRIECASLAWHEVTFGKLRCAKGLVTFDTLWP